jgi:hypothetical protein
VSAALPVIIPDQHTASCSSSFTPALCCCLLVSMPFSLSFFLLLFWFTFATFSFLLSSFVIAFLSSVFPSFLLAFRSFFISTFHNFFVYFSPFSFHLSCSSSFFFYFYLRLLKCLSLPFISLFTQLLLSSFVCLCILYNGSFINKMFLSLSVLPCTYSFIYPSFY